jgi:hypothetical protein
MKPSHQTPRPIRPHRGRPALLAAVLPTVVLLAVATACGGSDDDADRQEAPRDSVESTTDDNSEPGASTTTTVAAEGPSEWVEVARDVNRRDFALLESPDPDALSQVYAESCECWDDHLGTVRYLAERREHFEGQPTNVLFVRHEGTIGDGELHQITVKAQTNPAQRVDADGSVVQELSAGEPACVSLGLRADGADGAWRIYSETQLPECPEGA